MIGRLFGRKPNDDEAAKSADRLITSREPVPAVPPDARANDARIDAALEASMDSVSLSPLAQVLPATPAISAPPVVPGAPPASAAATPQGAPPPSMPAEPEPRVAPPAPNAPHAPLAADVPDPWLADAFDLLLAEEQGEAPATLYGGSYGLSEADLDRIAVRVVDRMTRGAMGDTVTRVVTEVAERLVREEIERIRQSTSPADGRP